MSEFAASMMGNSLPTSSNSVSTTTQGQANLAQNPDGTGFPQIFASINPEQTTLDSDVMALPLNPFAPLPLVNSADMPMAASMVTAGLADFTGNNLPQNLPAISVSGYVAQSDASGATAISFAGDEQQVFATTPQQATGLTTAVNQSQQQLRDGLQQHLQPAKIEIQDPGLSIQSKADTVKDMELIAELVKQSDLSNDSLINKPISTASFSQILSGPMSQSEFASTSVTTTRALEPMTANLQQSHWNTQIGERINMMISKGMQQAEIRLNPPELGLLEVKVKIQGDQANVNFSTPHAQVREALDAALPRLREMLEENGLTLGDVNVSHQSLAQGQSQSHDSGDEQPTNSGNGNPHSVEQTESDNSEINHINNADIGLLDVFA